ncbi:AI-2E family transporter [Microbacterium sediminicola]|uniref:AI-2E family transporter n=1 Tax=Microbacterium sediminicola TaxID=415210 RepID=A0ABN2IFC1_9MICO
MSEQPTPPADATPTDLTAAGGSTGATERTPGVRGWFNLEQPFAVGFFLVLGGLVAILLGLAVTNLATIIIYISFALFVALGLDPIVRALERRKITRTWGMVIVYSGFLLVIAGVMLLIMPTVVAQVAQFIKDIPQMINDFEKTDMYAWLQTNMGDQIGNILTEVENYILNPANIATIGGGVLAVGMSIATGISGGVIIIVLSLYFLATLGVIKSSFVRLTPARVRPKVADMTEQITSSIGGYLMGMVILAFFNSVVAFFLHLFLGLPFPALMAVLAFCITLIPLIGPVLYWGIATVIALFTDPVTALIFAILYLIYMQIEAYILTPRVMNRAVSVPGSLVVIGALVGGTLLGLLGALVAIPITASILLIIQQVVIPRQDAKV